MINHDQYIADFYFPELQILEEKIEYDRRRDKRLVQLGYKTLRIKDQDIYEHDNVALRIEQALEHRRQELGVEKPMRKVKK